MGAPHEAEIVACIPSLRRYARGLARDPEGADDLVQDTLERAWGRFPMWQGRGAVRAWMFGIMHNLYIDRMRRQRSRPEDSAGDDDFADTAARATPADGLELRDVERALQRLSAEYREVLLLVAVEELSYKEVAAAIRLPIGTVMSRLSRARERLRAELERRDVSPLIQRVK
jgi:RNA polymerase sigma-70 factor (ECF subfamily)